MDGDVKQFSNLLIYCCHLNTIGSVTALSQITFKSVEACVVLKCNTLVSRVMSGLYIYPFMLSSKCVSLDIMN